MPRSFERAKRAELTMQRSKRLRDVAPKLSSASRPKRRTERQPSIPQQSRQSRSPHHPDLIMGTEQTKQALMIAMLRQDRGISIAALAMATGWQRHSVRGFFAAVVKKRFGFDLARTRNQAGEWLYRIDMLSGRPSERAGDRVS